MTPSPSSRKTREPERYTDRLDVWLDEGGAGFTGSGVNGARSASASPLHGDSGTDPDHHTGRHPVGPAHQTRRSK